MVDYNMLRIYIVTPWAIMKKKSKTKWYRLKANQGMGWSQDGRGIGHRDHFLLYKFIKISFEFSATSTKQLRNAGGGHQAPESQPILFESR